MAGQGLFPFQDSRPVECRATARFFASSRRVVRPNFVDGAGLPYPPKTLPSHRRRARFTCTPHARQLSPYRPLSPRLKRDTDSPKIRLARSQSAQRQRLGVSPPEGPRNPPPTAISISDRPRGRLRPGHRPERRQHRTTRPAFGSRPSHAAARLRRCPVALRMPAPHVSARLDHTEQPRPSPSSSS